MAVDPEDIQVLSAAVQDSIARVGDIRFDPAQRRLGLLLNRFRWEDASNARGGDRVRSALQLSSVLSVRSKRLRRDAAEAVVSVLSIEFHPGDLPAGVVTITLSGGGELSCEVECIDVMLADVSEPWPARRRPSHPQD